MKLVKEETYLKLMGKRSIFVCNNSKSKRTILHAPGCALPETSINQGREVITKLHSMFAEFFKESDRAYSLPAVATPHHRE